MSLKGFHIVFILASIGLALFMGVWSGQAWLRDPSAAWAALSGSTFVLAVGLILYLVAFLRKFRETSSL